MEPAVVMDTNPFSQAKPGGCWGQAVTGARHPSDPPLVVGEYLSNAKALSQGALCSQHGRRQDSWKPRIEVSSMDSGKGNSWAVSSKSMAGAGRRGKSCLKSRISSSEGCPWNRYLFMKSSLVHASISHIPPRGKVAIADWGNERQVACSDHHLLNLYKPALKETVGTTLSSLWVGAPLYSLEQSRWTLPCSSGH